MVLPFLSPRAPPPAAAVETPTPRRAPVLAAPPARAAARAAAARCARRRLAVKNRGTPWENHGVDGLIIGNLVESTFFETSFYKFQSIILVWERGHKGLVKRMWQKTRLSTSTNSKFSV